MEASERDDIFPDPVSDGPPVPGEPRGDCENCGTPLLGEHCYACGQPVKGLVRHFSSIAGDFVDTVLDYDSRLPRTLWPLFARPGFLSREYFTGRRVRYVSPVRLFFTLSIVTFFVAQLLLSFGDEAINFGEPSAGRTRATGFAALDTVAAVQRDRDEILASLAKRRAALSADKPGADAGLRSAETSVRASAARRIDELNAQASAAPSTLVDGAPGVAPRADPDAAPVDSKKGSGGDSDDDTLTMFSNLGDRDEPWDPVRNPARVQWLPDFANAGLNSMMARAKNNVERWRKDPDQFKDALLGAVPSTLFILLPLFALMLKAMYAFKRRLYMEHLIVALHSHAFLCLALLLVFLTMALREWLAPGTGFLHGLFGWIEGALWAWMPVYLLLMQKRVYAQGWPMTLLKYAIIGWCYVFLLSVGAIFTVLASVVYG